MLTSLAPRAFTLDTSGYVVPYRPARWWRVRRYLQNRCCADRACQAPSAGAFILHMRVLVSVPRGSNSVETQTVRLCRSKMHPLRSPKISRHHRCFQAHPAGAGCFVVVVGLAKTNKVATLKLTVLATYRVLTTCRRGNTANIVRYFPTQALNFAFKDKYKKIFVRHNPKVCRPTRYLVERFCSQLAF
ncbi:MAG: LOW QUALITY PROTEIN: hypothetical protein BJ554DRAFT_269, partial [Olpidium bornovanus]